MPRIRKKDLLGLWEAFDVAEQAATAVMLSPAPQTAEVAAHITTIQDRLLGVRALLPKRPAAARKSDERSSKAPLSDTAPTAASKSSRKSSRKSKDSAAADTSKQPGKKSKRSKKKATTIR